MDPIISTLKTKKVITLVLFNILYYYLMGNAQLAVSFFGLNSGNYSEQFHFLPYAIQIIMTLIGVMTFFYIGKYRDYQRDMIGLYGKLTDFALEIDENDKDTKITALKLVLRNIKTSIDYFSRNTNMCLVLSFGIIIILGLSAKDILVGEIKNPEDTAKTLLTFIWSVGFFVTLLIYFEYLTTLHQNALLGLHEQVANTKHAIRSYKDEVLK